MEEFLLPPAAILPQSRLGYGYSQVSNFSECISPLPSDGDRHARCFLMRQ